MNDKFIERLKYMKDMDEVEVYMYIESLIYLLKRTNGNSLKKTLKKLIQETVRFGVSFENESFYEWFNYYQQYFNSLSTGKFNQYLLLYNLGMDTSIFKPNTWCKKDSFDQEATHEGEDLKNYAKSLFN